MPGMDIKAKCKTGTIKSICNKKFKAILRWEDCICYIPCSSSWLLYFGTRSSSHEVK